MSKLGPEEDVVRVQHMLEFAGKAVKFNRGKQRQDLDSDEVLALATIHLVEMLGEACRNVSPDLQKRYPEVPWELISGTRNRLAHGYIDVDLDIIWTIIHQDLPPLVRQLRKILKDDQSAKRCNNRNPPHPEILRDAPE
jgi:uncharacterized protein with HEPN domain